MGEADPASLDRLPVNYQDVQNYFASLGTATPFLLRRETFRRIEQQTGRPLICYVARTRNVPQGILPYIDDGDITGFGDLVNTTSGTAVDVFLTSNGGSAEATERIVRLLRSRFQEVRFILASNAYSAATLMCFSGNQILMDSPATLGPIDPQVNGVPARAILRAFETLQERLKQEGPRALTAYMPLLAKYDLHILEMCRSAQQLSEELARAWLSTHMWKCREDDPRVQPVIDFFASYDIHKSHGRSIDRERARDLGLEVLPTGDVPGLTDLVRSLSNQYEMWFDQTPFYKLYENDRGINWGRQAQSIRVELPGLIPRSAPKPAGS